MAQSPLRSLASPPRPGRAGRAASLTTLRLLVALSDGAPPAEFRIFPAGKVETSKGDFLFDAKAAASVMAAYADQGNELMVDYDHASLSVAIDPAQAGKAAGWFSLELRNGELWAVNVRWTEPAAGALCRAEWRYFSPAFDHDHEDGRILELVNVALTNIPATKRMQPLIAASALALLGGNIMSPDKIKAALQAIKEGDADKALELLEAMIAESAGGEPAEAPAEEPAEMADSPAEAPPAEDEDKSAVMAATSKLLRLTARETLGAAVDEIETWRESHLKLEAETVKLAKERAALESTERRELGAKLVKLGAETPHTSGLAKGKLCKRLAEEPIAELRARVEALSAARPHAGEQPVPPAGGGGGSGSGGKDFVTPNGTVTLSARELRFCAEAKADPAVYAANKAIQAARNSRSKE